MKKEEKKQKRVKCDNCGKLIHPLQDSYFVGDETVLCWDCLRIRIPQERLTTYSSTKKRENER